MRHFYEALASERKNPAIPEASDYFGKLCGSWKIDYVNSGDSSVIKGEWHFSRVLEGMAVQDVIILPGFEYGTTLRIYNPHTDAWDVAYGYTGRNMRLEAKKQDEMIVLTILDDERRKWVFVKIEDNSFHWQDVTVKENGEWHVDYDIYAQRA